MATPTKHTLGAKTSPGPPPRLHTLLCCGLCCSASCCFLLVGFRSFLPRTELEKPFKKRENPGCWEHGRAQGRWMKLKTGEDLKGIWGKSRKKARGSQQWMISLLKHSKYFSHWSDSAGSIDDRHRGTKGRAEFAGCGPFLPALQEKVQHTWSGGFSELTSSH